MSFASSSVFSTAVANTHRIKLALDMMEDQGQFGGANGAGGGGKDSPAGSGAGPAGWAKLTPLGGGAGS